LTQLDRVGVALDADHLENDGTEDLVAIGSPSPKVRHGLMSEWAEEEAAGPASS